MNKRLMFVKYLICQTDLEIDCREKKMIPNLFNTLLGIYRMCKNQLIIMLFSCLLSLHLSKCDWYFT